MEQLDKYKTGIKAYRNGFGIGLLIGTGICIYMGKPILFIPVLIALVMGSFFFERKLENNENS